MSKKQSSQAGQPSIPSYQQLYPGAQPAAQGQFDSGARFTSTTTPNIPPPPPGVMPTAVQVAAMQGGPVQMTQAKQAGAFRGPSSDGGMTTHFD